MKIYFVTLLFSISLFTLAQIAQFNLYNPQADAKTDLVNAVAQAKKENKNVFIQIGGNWCGWCKLFHDLVSSDEELKTMLADNFVSVHVNYSKENENKAVLAELDFPQRFGFPVFVILDQNGKRIHTQNSGYLEEGKGHSKKLVMEFLQNWTVEALNPKNY